MRAADMLVDNRPALEARRLRDILVLLQERDSLVLNMLFADFGFELIEMIEKRPDYVRVKNRPAPLVQHLYRFGPTHRLAIVTVFTDCVKAIEFVVQKDLFDGNIYNVLTLNATVREIVDIISANVDGVAIEYVDTRIMNQLSYTVLNDRFKALGFEFRGSLEKGIAETIELLGGIRSS